MRRNRGLRVICGEELVSWIIASASNVDPSEVIASCIEQHFSGAKGLYVTQRGR